MKSARVIIPSTICKSLNQLTKLLDAPANLSTEYNTCGKTFAFILVDGFVAGIARIDGFNMTVGDHVSHNDLASWLPTECIDADTWESIFQFVLSNTNTESTVDMRYAALCRLTESTVAVLNHWCNTVGAKKAAPLVTLSTEAKPVKKRPATAQPAAPEAKKAKVSEPEATHEPPASAPIEKNIVPPVEKTVVPPVATCNSPVKLQAAALVHYMSLPDAERLTLTDSDRLLLARIAAHRPDAISDYDLMHAGYAPSSPAVLDQLTFYTHCLEAAGAIHKLPLEKQ